MNNQELKQKLIDDIETSEYYINKWNNDIIKHINNIETDFNSEYVAGMNTAIINCEKELKELRKQLKWLVNKEMWYLNNNKELKYAGM